MYRKLRQARPKYFGLRHKGATWLNVINDQVMGLGGVVVPGTLRDSLFIRASAPTSMDEVFGRSRIHRAVRVAHLKLCRVTGQWMWHGGRQRRLAVHGTLRRWARALAVSPWCLAGKRLPGIR